MCVNTEFRENEKFIKDLFACTAFSEDKKNFQEREETLSCWWMRIFCITPKWKIA